MPNLNLLNYFSSQIQAPQPSKNWMSDIGKISGSPLGIDPSKMRGVGDFMKVFKGNLNEGMGQDATANLGQSVVNMFKGQGSGALADGASSLVSKGAGMVSEFTNPTNLASIGMGLAQSGMAAIGIKGQDDITKTGFDKGLDFASKLPLKYIPGVGQALDIGLKGLNLVNQHFGSSSHEQGTDAGLETIGYEKDYNQMAGKKFSLFGRSARKRANKMTAQVDRGNLSKAVPGSVEKRNTLASANTVGTIADKNYRQLHGSSDMGMLAARIGTKIPPVNLRNIANKAEWNKKKKLEEQKKKLEASKVLEKDTKYKDGGLLTKSDKEEVIEEVTEEKKNVIPEGAFHSRLNKYEEGMAEHVTRKGIPVITKDENGKVTQHAEVERNEIIFHKEATDTMETLHEKFKKADTQKLKDEIMIECGKYVAEQILVNTDDRTGIIKTI